MTKKKKKNPNGTSLPTLPAPRPLLLKEKNQIFESRNQTTLEGPQRIGGRCRLRKENRLSEEQEWETDLSLPPLALLKFIFQLKVFVKKRKVIALVNLITKKKRRRNA